MTAGVNDRFDFAAPVPAAEELGPVHFIAIGGSGMSGVARMYLARGTRVSGSDARDSATLRELEREGATVYVGHDAAHLGDAQTVIVSSAVRDTNPELVAARERGLRVLHRAQGIAALLPGRDAVAVAGANGKTTTSAMLTVALQHCGADPSYVLGAPIAGGTNASLGSGSAFVVEADESDGSFLVYRPRVAVVTNIKPDHLDFYGDLAAIERAFDAFAGTLRPGGLLVASADDPGARRLACRVAERGGRVVTFGTSDGADLRLSQVEGRGLRSRCRLTWTRDLDDVPSGTTAELDVPVPGRHNLLNAAAALLAATAGLGHDPDRALAGLASYPGTHRRFQPVGTAGGVQVFDDYAHNPDKVAAVVQAGRAVAGERRLVVLFQPHLYTRTRDFAEEFAAGLAGADVVAVADIYAAREDPLPGVTGELVVERLRGRKDFAGEVHYLPRREALAHELAALVRPGDVVLTVGAGDVTTVGPELLTLLGEGEA